eukprot:CAMPEP_0194218458 /NCGR_PEP_ID=MMETSP0156-20130528/23824_1 /TAXON_ID=33649 /ORGANISM="Thalassionema nitzschioides, Strain L26-B" /LENGTH=96 /DNA_ID=CAMNT_0038947823 /DNA_START=77 /DNA_END=365 /DNA_ORIENTATION=+
MGFDELMLVDDGKVLNREKTIHGASGAIDVLNRAKICSSIEEALDGADFACATGMPHSMHLVRPQQSYRAPRDFFSEILKDIEDEIRIAFVFGNEK